MEQCKAVYYLPFFANSVASMQMVGKGLAGLADVRKGRSTRDKDKVKHKKSDLDANYPIIMRIYNGENKDASWNVRDMYREPQLKTRVRQIRAETARIKEKVRLRGTVHGRFADLNMTFLISSISSLETANARQSPIGGRGARHNLLDSECTNGQCIIVDHSAYLHAKHLLTSYMVGGPTRHRRGPSLEGHAPQSRRPSSRIVSVICSLEGSMDSFSEPSKAER